MRRHGADSLRCSAGICCMRYFLILLLAWLHLASPASAAERNVVEIRDARYLISASSEIPPDDAQWRAVTLPHREARPPGSGLTPYWYKVGFDATDTIASPWLYFPKLRSGGQIYVNGVLVQEVRAASNAYQVRWFRPYLFFVPPLTLKKGHNEIAVHFAIREPLTSFGEIFVGPEQSLQRRYEETLFWEQVSARIANFICLLAGTLIIIFWLRRRNEIQYGLFGVCVLFWGIRTYVFRMPVVPMDWWVAWRFAYYLSTNGFIVFITLFLLQFSQARIRYVGRVLTAMWLGGCLLFLLVGTPLRPFMDTWWTLSFLPFTLYAVIRLAIFAVRERTPSGIAMVLAIVFALLLALHDYAVQAGLFGLPEYYLLHLGIPIYLLVMACVLLDRFIDSLRHVESVNERLTLRVAQRERELTATHEHLRQLERERARDEERQRIMQDMHDGVGSQLLSTLLVAQRGGTTHADMVALLRNCLDDMRLAIDSLTPNEPDFLAVLGNFRFRMEARFRDLEMTLAWRNHQMPEAMILPPRTILQLLRMMQEALTNIIKHAGTTGARVEVAFSADRIDIEIADAGTGIAAGGKPAGHGLSNMAARAAAIGASLRIERREPGTAVIITLPLPGADAAVSSGTRIGEPAATAR
jgi:signal transduction histidine kinase